MTKILRDYIERKVEDPQKSRQLILALDDHYGEALDFAAEDLIESKLIDELITNAEQNIFKEY